MRRRFIIPFVLAALAACSADAEDEGAAAATQDTVVVTGVDSVPAPVAVPVDTTAAAIPDDETDKLPTRPRPPGSEDSTEIQE